MAAEPPWPPGPLHPEFGVGTLHIWRVDTARAAQVLGHERMLKLLTPQERERALRMRVRERRELWLAAHVALRRLLARYLGGKDEDVDIVIDDHGKPQLAGAKTRCAEPLHFNLSHSARTMLCAVSGHGAVGVDVEAVVRQRDYAAIARRAFGESEAAQLRSLDPAARQRRFLDAWTRREAELKLRGGGFGGGISTGEEFDGHDGFSAASEARQAVWIETLDLGDRAAGAIAVEHAPSELLRWVWAP